MFPASFAFLLFLVTFYAIIVTAVVISIAAAAPLVLAGFSVVVTLASSSIPIASFTGGRFDFRLWFIIVIIVIVTARTHDFGPTKGDAQRVGARCSSVWQ
jgi:cytochrome b561